MIDKTSHDYSYYDFDELDFDEYLDYVNGIEMQQHFLDRCYQLTAGDE